MHAQREETGPAPDVVFVALGSNLGDRNANLRRARMSIEALPDTRVTGMTEIEATEPIGPPQDAYLNQMLKLETTLAPHALLDALQRIELEGGRVRGERWGPRMIDLDIVQFGARRLHDARLRIPHPELPHRDFWQRELAALGGRP